MRYGRDFEQYRSGMRGYDRGYGGTLYGSYGSAYGGMRSDAGRTRWRDFAGEGGWPGAGYAGTTRNDYGRRPRDYGRDYARHAGYAGYDAAYAMGSDVGLGNRFGGRLARGPHDAFDVRARDLMTENPETVSGDTSLADAAKKMRELDVGIIPVVESDTQRLSGVITDRDIAVRAVAEGKDVKKAKVGDFMTTDVATCREGDHVRDLFDVMKRERVRRVPITDAEGRLVGIVAQADLAVDYAGLDLQRETEVEEVIERISEPAEPRWGGARYEGRYGQRRSGGAPDLGDRLRQGWKTLKHEARDLMHRGYDRGWL